MRVFALVTRDASLSSVTDQVRGNFDEHKDERDEHILLSINDRFLASSRGFHNNLQRISQYDIELEREVNGY